MSAQMALIYREQIATVAQGTRTYDTYVVTGLNNGFGTIVPFPAQLANAPKWARLVRIGNATPGAQVTFDSSQGETDPSGALAIGKLGVDQNNAYLFCARGFQCILQVEY